MAFLEVATRDIAYRRLPAAEELHVLDGAGLKKHRRLATILINLTRNERSINAGGDHLGSRCECARVGVLVLEAPRIGNETSVGAQSDVARVVDAHAFREFPDEHRCCRHRGIAIGKGAHRLGIRVMIDSDRIFRLVEQARCITDPLAVRDIDGHERPDLPHEVACVDHIGKPRKEGETNIGLLGFRQNARHPLSEALQDSRQGELRAQTIAVRTHMPADHIVVARFQNRGNLRKRNIRLRGDRHATRPLLPLSR